jgi:RNA polymerase sigma-70 factor (ECF subfamily)
VDSSDRFEEIVAAARRGDEWAIVELYRSVHPGIHRYLRAQAGEEGEDLAAETWLDVAEGIGRFRGNERDFRAWTFTIARRRLLDRRRQAARRRTDPVPQGELPEPRPAESAEAQALEAISTAEALRRISALPPDQAEVVLLGVLGGLGAKEIAKIVGKREGTVRVLRHRALKRLGGGYREASRPARSVAEEV